MIDIHRRSAPPRTDARDDDGGMKLASSLALPAALAVGACHSPPRLDPSAGRLCAVGGHDAPGDADQVYFQHATPDGAGVALTILVLPDGWRARERVVSKLDGALELADIPDPELLGPGTVEPRPEACALPAGRSESQALDRQRWTGPRPLLVATMGAARPSERELHQERASGRDVYRVALGSGATPDRVRVEVFGGDGWPLEWVRLAHFDVAPPAYEPPPRDDGVLTDLMSLSMDLLAAVSIR